MSKDIRHSRVGFLIRLNSEEDEAVSVFIELVILIWIAS